MGRGGRGGSEGPPSRDARLACAGLAYKPPPSSVGPSSRGAGKRMGERGGGMAGHAPREPRIRRGKGRGCPREGHEGAAGRREGGRMGKFPSEGRIAPRGAFKRVLRGLGARGGGIPRGGICTRGTKNPGGFPSGMKGGGKSSGRRADASENPRIPGCLGARIARYARRAPRPARKKPGIPVPGLPRPSPFPFARILAYP